MGGLLAVGKTPAARSTATWPRSTRFTELARRHGQQRLRRHLLHLRRARGRHDRRRRPRSRPRRRASAPAPARPAPTTSRSRSRSCAATPAIDGVYKAFVAKVGGDLNESTRMQANAQVLADSVENRRQSVAGRLDGRGDVQPRALPACLPGLRPRHVDDGRDAGRPHQPDRKGRPVAMRITTSMVQRNVLSDLNTLSEQLAKTQSKASSGKEITRPSDDPFKTPRRRWACARARRQRAVHAQHPGRAGLAGRDRVRAGLDHRLRQPRARPARCRAPTDTADADLAQRDRRRDRPDHPGHQGDRERQLRRHAT